MTRALGSRRLASKAPAGPLTLRSRPIRHATSSNRRSRSANFGTRRSNAGGLTFSLNRTPVPPRRPGDRRVIRPEVRPRPRRLERRPATIIGGRRLYFPQLMISWLYACICSAPKWRRLTSGIFLYRHCSRVAIKFKFIKYPTGIWTFPPCYIIAPYRQVHGSRFELAVAKKPISIYLKITLRKTTKFDCF